MDRKIINETKFVWDASSLTTIIKAEGTENISSLVVSEILKLHESKTFACKSINIDENYIFHPFTINILRANSFKKKSFDFEQRFITDNINNLLKHLKDLKPHIKTTGIIVHLHDCGPCWSHTGNTHVVLKHCDNNETL